MGFSKIGSYGGVWGEKNHLDGWMNGRMDGSLMQRGCFQDAKKRNMDGHWLDHFLGQVRVHSQGLRGGYLERNSFIFLIFIYCMWAFYLFQTSRSIIVPLNSIARLKLCRGERNGVRGDYAPFDGNMTSLSLSLFPWNLKLTRQLRGSRRVRELSIFIFCFWPRNGDKAPIPRRNTEWLYSCTNRAS